jgi:putative SOS response-associated peptidase YedK
MRDSGPESEENDAPMCGKFTQLSSWQQVHAFSQPLVGNDEAAEVIVATPMRLASIMRLDSVGKRELVSMRWGFAGKGDANPSRPKHMHARGETLDQLPTFAQAFASARGILMVHTFNEGEELPNGKTRQWVITPRDGQPIAIAVICETWRNGPQTLETFVQVTAPANALIARISDRMPVILPREAWSAWLGETRASPAEVKALLRTYDDGGNWVMEAQAHKRPARARKPRVSSAQQDLF